MQPGYVMAGWERDRQEPVLMPIPVPDTREAPPSLRAVQLLCRPGPFESGMKRLLVLQHIKKSIEPTLGAAAAVCQRLQRWKRADQIRPSRRNVRYGREEGCLSSCPSYLAPRDKALWRWRSEAFSLPASTSAVEQPQKEKRAPIT